MLFVGRNIGIIIITINNLCCTVALFSCNINESNQQTVRGTTAPLSEGTHIRIHLLKVVNTLVKNLFN